MAEEAQQAERMPIQQQGGGLSAIRAYGLGGSGGHDNELVGALAQMLAKQASNSNDWDAFAAGALAPSHTSGFSGNLSSALQAQVGQRNEEMKLRAQYIPMVMSTLLQNQQMGITAAKSTQDLNDIWYKNIASDMAGLAARKGDSPITANDLDGVLRVGAQNNRYDPAFAERVFQQASKDPNGFVRQYVTGASPAGDQVGQTGGKFDLKDTDRGIVPVSNIGGKPHVGAPIALPPNTPEHNAIGQTQFVNAASRQVLPATGGGTGQPGDPSGQPTNATNTLQTAVAGNAAKQDEDMRIRVSAYQDLMGRMNEQKSLIQQFRAGPTAEIRASAGNHLRDLLSAIPGVSPDTANALGERLSQGDPAAVETFKALAAQDNLAQLRTVLSDGNHTNRSEINLFNTVGTGPGKNPMSFEQMYDFSKRQYKMASDKFDAWSNYNGDPTKFDNYYNQKVLPNLSGGSRMPSQVGPGAQAASGGPVTVETTLPAPHKMQTFPSREAADKMRREHPNYFP